ncbi:exosortase A [Thalassotalea maritima]|uniref:exosortase A n=1 Tax=Thalassotalea maritima TaxID=3242416 RepID=UPI0035281FE0
MPIASYRFLLLLTLSVLIWLIVFWDAVFAMEAIWRRSDTFAHGYFILPISVYLLLRQRCHLKHATASPTWLGVVLLVLVCAVYLLAFAADINVLMQLSAVLALIFICYTLIGHHLAWHYKFPLAYLIFMVPMGENLIPALQEITADISVLMLNLFGISNFREGLYIQLPSGMFEVAVACSGIRYLIACLALGTVYAHLTYRSLPKQLLFIAFSIAMPIVANGIRAFLIMFIAHTSDMKYATGVDHLIYGWLFFGFVIVLMFYIGNKFADCGHKASTASGFVKADTSVLYGHISALIVTLLLTIQLQKNVDTVTWASVHASTANPNLQQPKDVGKRQNMAGEDLWGIEFQNALKHEQVAVDGIDIFQAFYANKQDVGELINHHNQTHNPNRWTIVSSEILHINSQPFRLIELRDIQQKSLTYLYHYGVGSAYYTDQNIAKLAQAWQSLRGDKRYSYVFALSLPVEKQRAKGRFIDYLTSPMYVQHLDSVVAMRSEALGEEVNKFE